MTLNEGGSFGNELAFAGGRNYNQTFGLSASGLTAEVMPRFASGISYGIKGIPWKSSVYRQTASITQPGNTITPLFYRTDTNGIRRFGLDMGRGFGPTAQGFTQRGLTFASWTNNDFDGAITPKLSMVYSCQPLWYPQNATFVQINGVGRGYEARIGDGSIGGGFNMNLKLGLQTFYDGYTLGLSSFPSPASITGVTATKGVDPNVTKEWIIARNYTQSTDNWSESALSSNPQSYCIVNSVTDGTAPHWTINGFGGNAWSTGVFTINGRNNASVPGSVILLSNNTPATITAFIAAINTLGNGLTLEDQYGNLYFASPGTIVAKSATRVAAIDGHNIRYGSGTIVGTPWTGPTVIGNFPREWIFNGDAPVQYAPLKIDINLANSSLYNTSAPV